MRRPGDPRRGKDRDRRLRPGVDPVWIVAHRGDSASSPENTAAAFDAAASLPVDGIEIDVQLSRDGVLVVYHDRTLRRLGGGNARVEDLDLVALRRLDAGSWFEPRFRGERLLTLDEVMDRWGRRTRLLLELKVREPRSNERVRMLVERTVSAIRARRGKVDPLILSFDSSALDATREEAPEIPTVRNLDRIPTGRDRWIRLGPLAAVSVDRRVLTPAFVAEAHERGTPVLAYTCNSARSLARAMRSGVDGIMSDRPGWLWQVLARGRGSSVSGRSEAEAP